MLKPVLANLFKKKGRLLNTNITILETKRAISPYSTFNPMHILLCSTFDLSYVLLCISFNLLYNLLCNSFNMLYILLCSSFSP